MRDFEVAGVFNYSTGTPYTPEDQKGNEIGLENSARLPNSYTLDGRIGKDFTFAGMSLSLTCDITNVLNSEIITNVHEATGKPDYTGRDDDHDGFITRSEQYESYLRAYTDKNTPPTYFGPPRKIRLGLSLSF